MKWQDVFCEGIPSDSELKRQYYEQYVASAFEWRHGLNHIGRLLALGGMAAVFECPETDTGKDRAIKLFDPPRFDKNLVEYRFWREIKMSLHPKLKHKNILSCIDGGETVIHSSDSRESQFFAFLLMESASSTLANVIRKTPLKLRYDKNFSEYMKEVMRDILLGLRHMHEHGITHRDINASNILQVSGVWKLSDLGLSRKGSLGIPTVVAGTPGYVPFGFASRALPRGDFLSLGIMLIHCFTGELPAFPGTSPSIVKIQSLMQSDYVELSASGLPEWAQDFVRVCLSMSDSSIVELMRIVGMETNAPRHDRARESIVRLYERITSYTTKLPAYKDSALAAMISVWDGHLTDALYHDRYDVALRESFLSRAISLFESASSAYAVSRVDVSSFWTDESQNKLVDHYLKVQPSNTARIFVFNSSEQVQDYYALLHKHYQIYGESGAILICSAKYFDGVILPSLVHSAESMHDLMNRDFGILTYVEGGELIRAEAVLNASSFTFRPVSSRSNYINADNVHVKFQELKRLAAGSTSQDQKIWRIANYSFEEWVVACNNVLPNMFS